MLKNAKSKSPLIFCRESFSITHTERFLRSQSWVILNNVHHHTYSLFSLIRFLPCALFYIVLVLCCCVGRRPGGALHLVGFARFSRADLFSSFRPTEKQRRRKERKKRKHNTNKQTTTTHTPLLTTVGNTLPYIHIRCIC